MTLTECKEFMRLYQRGAEGEQYNWRTTARWALRHKWAQGENDKLQDALRYATERAQQAEAALAAMRMERDYYEASWRRAEGERFEADVELDECRAPRLIEGTLPADDLRRAFADGAAWWNFNSTGFTMFGSERREAEAEAEARFPNGKPGPVEVQP